MIGALNLCSPCPLLKYFAQELEKELERLSQVGNKLKSAEGEIHTLKSFLTSKTAMVERRKKEIQEVVRRAVCIVWILRLSSSWSCNTHGP